MDNAALSKIYLRITTNFPRELWISMREASSFAFHEAYQNSLKFQLTERKFNTQLRHPYLEGEFRDAGRANGLQAECLPTTNGSYTFSAIKSGGVYLLRCNIQPNRGKPRATKFRKEYSFFNKFLEPLQYPLFEKLVEPPEDKLCLMLIVTSHKMGRGMDDVPAFVGIGIPNSDCSGWLMQKSIGEILALYDVAKPIDPVDPTIIVDRVIPKLKKKDNAA